MNTKEVAELITETVRLALQEQGNRLGEIIKTLRDDLRHERRIWCDKPEDRLYHEADNTWWFRGNDLHPYGAPPPEPVVRIATELLKLHKNPKRKISSAVLEEAQDILDYASQFEK